MKNWKGYENLKNIKNHTLIVWGDRDKSYNFEQVDTLKKNIINSKIEIFKDCCHNVHLEKPAKFNKAINQFLKDKKNIEKTFVIAGGVAANLKIRESKTKLSKEKKFSPIFPSVDLCSDNAAMIAWAGIERYKMKLIDNLEFPSKARWPLDTFAPFLKGSGLKI